VLVMVAAGLVLAVRSALAPKPTPVRTTIVERGLVEESVTNSRAGTVKARRRARLSPETGGRVAELPYSEGQRVTAGAVILRLDASSQRASLSLAERDLGATEARRDEVCLAAEQAEREHRRAVQLAQEGIVSTDLLDRARSRAEAMVAACRAAGAASERSRAAVDLADSELRKTVLRAPFAGILAKLDVEVGEWTSPSPPALPIPPIVDIIDTTSIYISAPMDEVDSARVKPGQAARVTVDSYPGESFRGRVTRVAPFVLDRLEQNRTVEIEVELEAPQRATSLLPGTSADVEVILDQRDDALRIPTSALFEGRHVLIISEGRLEERTVEIGLRNWEFAEVRGGVSAGDRVVVTLDSAEVEAGALVVEEDEEGI